MAAPAAKKVEVALVEGVRGILKDALNGSNQTIALGTQQSTEANNAALARDAHLSERLDRERDDYNRLRGDYDKLHKELCEERAKNGAHTVELERLKNANTQAHMNRMSQQEAIAAARDLSEKVTKLVTMNQLLKIGPGTSSGGVTNGAAVLSDRPPTERLIEELLRDLSPATMKICFAKTRHVVLPLLAQKSFLVSFYNALFKGGSPDPEMIAAFVGDLGADAFDRVSAITRSAGFDQ